MSVNQYHECGRRSSFSCRNNSGKLSSAVFWEVIISGDLWKEKKIILYAKQYRSFLFCIQNIQKINSDNQPHMPGIKNPVFEMR